MNSYACTAETEDGRGRCRNNANDGDPDRYCSFHAQQRDGGKEVKKASRPKKVLFKANINPRWAAQFKALGIPEKHPDFQRQNETHAADAARVGREAYAVRANIADSGVPVFGKNIGLQNCIVVEPLSTLMQGYRLTDIHLFQRRDKGAMSVLVVTFEEGSEGAEITLPLDIAKFFALSNWGFVHVWANPPKEDGTVVHTVNLSHKSMEAAKQQLLFADGLWTAKPC